MATTETVGKQIAKTEPVKDLRSLIESSAKELARALPDNMRPERLVRIALTCIRLNPELAKCTPESFLGSLFVAAQLGLEPVAGRAYLLPFSNKRKIGNEWKTFKEVQLIVGFRGLIELFYRHEAAISIDMQVVFANDAFSYQYGTDPFLHHTPALKDRGPVVGYYTVAKVKSGGTIFFFMSHEDAMEHGKKHSKTFDRQKNEFYASSPWAKEPAAMAQKTTLIQLAKRLPLSIEIQQAISADETSRSYKSGIDSALDLAPTTDWTEDPVTPESPKEGPLPAQTEGKQSSLPYEPGVE